MTSFNATVRVIEDVAPDVRLLGLLVDDDGICHEAGGHVDVEVIVAGIPQIRSYSLVGLCNARELIIAVKLAPHGRGGSKYIWSLRSGANVRIWRARNTLAVTFEAVRYVLIAGGIGITPIYAVAKALRDAGKSVSLHYCIRDIAKAPFLRELRSLLSDDLTIHASSVSGRLNIEEIVSNADTQVIYYVCGPLSLMESVNRVWRSRGLPTENLRFETFGNSGRFPNTAFEVHVRETGAVLVVGEAESLLDALIAAGQDVLHECRRGECGLCKVEIEHLNGEVDHRDVFFSAAERETASAMCCCVSRVYGPSTVIRINHITHGRASREVLPCAR